MCEWKHPVSKTVCGQSFGLRAHLNQHVRLVHEMARTFLCEWKHPVTGTVCGKSFGARSTLSKHMTSVHHTPDDLPPHDMHPLVGACESQCLPSDHVDMVELLSNPGPTKLWEYVDDWDNPTMGESCWREV